MFQWFVGLSSTYLSNQKGKDGAQQDIPGRNIKAILLKVHQPGLGVDAQVTVDNIRFNGDAGSNFGLARQSPGTRDPVVAQFRIDARRQNLCATTGLIEYLVDAPCIILNALEFDIGIFKAKVVVKVNRIDIARDEPFSLVEFGIQDLGHSF